MKRRSLSSRGGAFGLRGVSPLRAEKVLPSPTFAPGSGIEMWITEFLRRDAVLRFSAAAGGSLERIGPNAKMEYPGCPLAGRLSCGAFTTALEVESGMNGLLTFWFRW